MEIYPVYLLCLLLIIIISRIKTTIDKENNYHGNYLLTYFILLLLITLNLGSYLLIDFKLPSIILTITWVLSKIIFFLYLKSILKQKRVKITFKYFFPLIILLLSYFLNKSEIRFFNFFQIPYMNQNILGFTAYDFIGKEDYFIVFFLNTLVFSFLTHFTYYKSKNTEVINHKQREFISNFFIYFYNQITFVSISLPLILFLYLLDKSSDISVVLIKLLIIVSYTILIIKPDLLKNLLRIKIVNNMSLIELKRIFNILNNTMETKMRYLDTNYNQANLSIDSGVRIELIRNAIKSHAKMTVPLYINSFRVEYACDQIKNGFLKNYSMDALAEKSGFNSLKNFNRVFKVLKEITPSEYQNNNA